MSWSKKLGKGDKTFGDDENARLFDDKGYSLVIRSEMPA
jgi:hypothetical protein